MKKFIHALIVSTAFAASAQTNVTTIQFLQFDDLHAHLTPHKALVRHGDPAHPDTNAFTTVGMRGGMARLATLVKQLRAQNTNSVLMVIGDAYHGGVEAAFTDGNAIVAPLNALGIDVSVPGNWDYAYGPGVFRERYTTAAIPPAMQMMLPNFPVLAVTYSNVAANLTYAKLGPKDPTVNGSQVLPPTMLKTVGGVKVGFIGLTSDIVPEMYAPLSMGFNFFTGLASYTNIVNTQAAALRAAGAKIVVVMSELGIHKNFAVAQAINSGAVDVFFSAHTHEVIYNPLVSASGALVVESGDSGYLGQMSVTVSNGVPVKFDWQLNIIGDQIAEDPAMKALVDAARAPFLVPNPNMTDPQGYMNASPQVLNQPITNIVAYITNSLTRQDALENSFNNFFTDALRAKAGTRIAMTPGFRMESVVGLNGLNYEDPSVADGAVTLEDAYRFFPVLYTLATGQTTGANISNVVEQALAGTFSTNAFSQGGGWVDGFSGIAVTLNLTNADFHRVQSMRYTDDGEPIYPTDTISAAGCQRPLDATNTLCSYTGFSNVQTFTNTATGQAWTPVDMFVSAISNSAAYPPRQNFTDVSGLPRWPQDPFVQNLLQSHTAMPSPAPTLALTQTSTGAQLNVAGQPGRLYTLQHSANFQTWISQGTNWSLTGTNIFSDSQATNQPAGFYRASTP